MKLQKRDCRIKAVFKPSGTRFLGVTFDFGNEKLEFSPSSAVGGQLGDLICALYTLYHEGAGGGEAFDGHCEWNHRKSHTAKGSSELLAVTVEVDWDDEGTFLILEMTKRLDQNSILLRTTTDFHKTHKEYTVDDREFCYAVAKGCTEVLKEYGIYGFRRSTGGEPIILHQLLFIKAYALGDLQARELTAMDKWSLCRKTDFEKEMELLLFDM